jgi:hypothetical protein
MRRNAPHLGVETVAKGAPGYTLLVGTGIWEAAIFALRKF